MRFDVARPFQGRAGPGLKAPRYTDPENALEIKTDESNLVFVRRSVLQNRNHRERGARGEKNLLRALRVLCG